MARIPTDKQMIVTARNNQIGTRMVSRSDNNDDKDAYVQAWVWVYDTDPRGRICILFLFNGELWCHCAPTTPTKGDARYAGGAADGVSVLRERKAMDTIKLCINCKWIEKKSWFDRQLLPKDFTAFRCMNPAALKENNGEDLVKGPQPPFCSVEREYGNCGRDAKLFEEKP